MAEALVRQGLGAQVADAVSASIQDVFALEMSKLCGAYNSEGVYLDDLEVAESFAHSIATQFDGDRGDVLLDAFGANALPRPSNMVVVDNQLIDVRSLQTQGNRRANNQPGCQPEQPSVAGIASACHPPFLPESSSLTNDSSTARVTKPPPRPQSSIHRPFYPGSWGRQVLRTTSRHNVLKDAIDPREFSSFLSGPTAGHHLPCGVTPPETPVVTFPGQKRSVHPSTVSDLLSDHTSCGCGGIVGSDGNIFEGVEAPAL